MDYNEPFEIASNIYWVGHRSDHNFDMNVYLRVFQGNGRKLNMLIDPGPHTDFEVISSKVEKILGPDEKIHLAFINHQDPDVCINTVFFQRHYPEMQVVTSEDTWRLIRFYGLDKNRFTPVEKFKGNKIKLSTGHRLRFIPTPYVHFRGACALYDDEHQILFSGDLFGGLSTDKALYAKDVDWTGIKIFHQIYMPVNKALKKAVHNIHTMAPNVKILAPQHGKIITKELVQIFTDRLENLQVGLDIETSTLNRESYMNAINEMAEKAEELVGPEVVKKTLDSFGTDGSFPDILSVENNRVTGVKIGLDDALDVFSSRFAANLTQEQKSKVQPVVRNTLATWQILNNSEKYFGQQQAENDTGESMANVLNEVHSRLNDIFL